MAIGRQDRWRPSTGDGNTAVGMAPTTGEVAYLSAQYVDAHSAFQDAYRRLLNTYRDDRVPLETFVQQFLIVTEHQRRLRTLREELTRAGATLYSNLVPETPLPGSSTERALAAEAVIRR